MVLGVQYQLANVWQGRLVLGNKPGRLEKILDFVEQLCTAGEGARKTAATLAGLMNFAGGFVMGLKSTWKPANLGYIQHTWLEC